MTGAFVYRAYAADGTLLYVGSSATPQARYRYHAQHSAWWPRHSEIREEQHATVALARRAETAAILAEFPRWNVVGRSSDHPDGPISQTYGVASAPWLRADLDAWRAYLRTRAA